MRILRALLLSSLAFDLLLVLAVAVEPPRVEAEHRACQAEGGIYLHEGIEVGDHLAHCIREIPIHHTDAAPQRREENRDG